MKAGKINLIRTILLFAACLLLVSCKRSLTLKEYKELRNYPSGSGIEYFKDRIYLIGDDANYLAVLNPSFEVIDTVNLVGSQQKSIAKELKPDIEAATLIKENRSWSILLVGSESLIPNRTTGWIINTSTKEKQQFGLDTFYNRLKARGIAEINIEGIASTPGVILMANRGNKGYPRNHLIFTSSEFWKDQSHAFIKILPVGGSTDTAHFSGVSGLAYSYKSDRLILTVSTENTYSSQADGAISKSYLWVIDDISSKRRFIAVNPNKIIDLHALDKRFEGHKMESVCIVSETNKRMDLILVADNDKGTTVLFKVVLMK